MYKKHEPLTREQLELLYEVLIQKQIPLSFYVEHHARQFWFYCRHCAYPETVVSVGDTVIYECSKPKNKYKFVFYVGLVAKVNSRINQFGRMDHTIVLNCLDEDGQPIKKRPDSLNTVIVRV